MWLSAFEDEPSKQRVAIARRKLVTGKLKGVELRLQSN